MRRAGTLAADEIAAEFPDNSATPVIVFAGSGNNGGDGWVVARSLASRGYPVRVAQTGPPRSAESQDAKARALASGVVEAPFVGGVSAEPVVIDAVLGTGFTGIPRGEAASAIAEIERRRENGARIIAIDLPSGLDATTGEHEGSVIAHRSITFGTVKRGQLIARDVCGEISILDIGLIPSREMSALPELVQAEWVHSRVPRISSAAHKGTRKSLAIVGGGKGMAGAAILAGEGALRSGLGLLRIVASAENALPVHAGLPAAIFHSWPDHAEDLSRLIESVDALAIGPGLGASDATRDLVERVLLASNCPVVLDADALNVFAADTDSLATLLRGRAAVITPHPAELGRLLSLSTADVVASRFEVGSELAAKLGAAVLLKGSPTVVFAPDGKRLVSASGTSALATGGSGDVLTGMVGTLLAQMCSSADESSAVPAEAATCAAFIHGRAAELCSYVRGTTLDDVLHAMPAAWNEIVPPLRPNVLAALGSYP
jgi:NAD(P)H-hydrate epimerase